MKVSQKILNKIKELESLNPCIKVSLFETPEILSKPTRFMIDISGKQAFRSWVQGSQVLIYLDAYKDGLETGKQIGRTFKQ